MNAPPPQQPHPALDLLARYKAVLQAAWALRHELAGPERLADERAFLPAALALQDSPVHPAPRRAALVLCALFALALLWAMLGRIDVVAVAPGRIVVSQRSKLIQPLEASVVSRVLVKDGERVTAGQVLIELDATVAAADRTSVAEQLEAADTEVQRSSALLAALHSQRAPRASLPGDAQLQAEWQDIAARLDQLDAQAQQRQAELATVRQAIAKLDATLPLARQREADVLALAEQGFMNRHAGQDRTRERIEIERDLALQHARLAEAQAAIAESRRSRSAYQAETRRNLSQRQTQARLQREQLLQERSKTEQRSRLTRLTAPVDGTVQQLAVHTAGGVVTPAQVLLVVVPHDAEVTAEVVLENKDVGFVREGQGASIKLETFPYTRYGTVPASVLHISADAVLDDKRGALFAATLGLGQASVDVEGRAIRLSPGMNLSAEIKTGQRRVIDYLLEPLQQHLGESLRER